MVSPVFPRKKLKDKLHKSTIFKTLDARQWKRGKSEMSLTITQACPLSECLSHSTQSRDPSSRGQVTESPERVGQGE